MQNTETHKYYSLQSVLPMYKRLFGTEYDLYDMLELSPIVLRSCGGYKTGRYLGKTTIKDFKATLPCDIFKIVSVSLAVPLSEAYASASLLRQENQLIGDTNAFTVTNSTDFPNYNIPFSSYLLNANKNTTSPPLGKLVDFKWESEEELSFNFDGVEIDIIYDSLLLADDGYPCTDEKSLLALAYYLNFINMQKALFQRLGDPNLFTLAVQLKDKHIAQARVGTGFTDNELNKLMDVMTSHNRKKYNYDLKLTH